MRERVSNERERGRVRERENGNEKRGSKKSEERKVTSHHGETNIL